MDIAGHNKANSAGMLLSATHMLHHMGSATFLSQPGISCFDKWV